MKHLLDPANRAAPYELYARIRAAAPLRADPSPVTIFASYRHCQALLRHPQVSSDWRKSPLLAQRLAQGPPAPPGMLGSTDDVWFLFLDPPDHTRLRRLVSKAFSARVVAQLEQTVGQLVDELLDACVGQNRIELVDTLAHPLPVAVVCRLLGVPEQDEPSFREWSRLLAEGLDPVISLSGTVSAQTAADRYTAAVELNEYFRSLVKHRRNDPGSDLLSSLIVAEESGDQLTEGELISTCVLMLFAGHETTVNLLANALLALLRHPDQWQALAAEPDRAELVVEETLRYDPPVQLIMRAAVGDLTVEGTTVPGGELLMMLVAAAHRDPQVHDDPDTFDPDRSGQKHLAFALGPHFCLGAPLARLEAKVALPRIVRRLRGARLAEDPPRYKPNLTLRGVEELVVTVDEVRPADT